jgi:hypothetical protein
VSLVAGNKYFSAVYGEDLLFVFSATGRRLKDEVLFSNVTWMTAEKNFFFVLTEEFNY